MRVIDLVKYDMTAGFFCEITRLRLFYSFAFAGTI